MKIIILIFLIILTNDFSYAQSNIKNYDSGFFIDINEEYIDEFYDLFNNPDKFLFLKYSTADIFIPGYYFSLQNEKIPGLIKTEDDFSSEKIPTFFKTKNITYSFEFKSNKKGEIKTITHDDCNGYIRGENTFDVIQNFKVERQLLSFKSEEKAFAKIIDRFGNLTFYQHTWFGINSIVLTYILKIDSSDNYVSFPKNKKFKEIISPYVSNFPALQKKIEENKYSEYNIPSISKLLKYKYFYQNNKKTFYTAWWDETEDESKSSYYSLVESIEDSIFKVKFYDLHDNLLFDGHFTSFYPPIKNGIVNWYYKNGMVKKNMEFENDKPINFVNIFYMNGNLHYQFQLEEKVPVYKQVRDTEGKNLLNDSGNGDEVVYDSLMNHRIINKFENGRLSYSYYTDETGKLIYLNCNQNAKLKKFEPLEELVKEKIIYPVKSIKENHHGFILVKCLIEPSGLTSNLEIINGVDNECDSVTLSFLSFMKSYKHWKPGKVNNANVTQEIILPVNFSLVGHSDYHSFNSYLFNRMYMFPPPIQPAQLPNFK